MNTSTTIHKTTILLIDDDEKLATLLSQYFTKFDITLISEVMPSKGLQALNEQKPDLVILDVMLPEMDGFEVCQKIRECSNTPIIMLTARGDVDDRVAGLGFGADDYLPKPFNPRELVARIETILSRVQPHHQEVSNTIIQLPDLTINTTNHEIKIHDTVVEFTAKEYTLLVLMAENPEKLFTREDIVNAVNGIDNTLCSRSTDILVSRLRNKLKPLEYIQTVWGKGYKLTY